MKIIEGLKDLKLTLKKIEDQQARISQLASVASNEIPSVGGSVEAQTKEVANLVQSIFDLGEYYTSLKLRLEKTNNQVSFEIGGATKTITEWLAYQRGLGQTIISTVRLLNTSRAEGIIRNTPAQMKSELKSIPCYDAKIVGDKFQIYADNLNIISAKLEVINATTDIVD